MSLALLYLSGKQQSDGGFDGTCETTAQVILALNEVGVALDNSYFVKNGHSLTDHLLSFQQANGGFGHKQGEAATISASEAAMRALVSTELTVQGVTFFSVR